MKRKFNLGKNGRVFLFAAVTMSIYSCSGSSESEDFKTFHYLPVQMETDGNWSIIDADGNVVVADEYPADNKLSAPTKNGLYWVQAKDKYSLYSVESAKSPVSQAEYDNVTDFRDGRAFVSVFGEPIQMIDETGKVVTTLPEDVTEVWAFNDGMAAYKSKQNDCFGFMNKDAEVVVQPCFKYFIHYNDGYAVVMDESQKWKVLDKKGKTVEDWGKSGYLCIGMYSDGVFAAVDSAEWSVCYLDKKGKVAIKPTRKAKHNEYGFMDYSNGTAIVYDEDKNPGLIDKNGEFLIRYGKYKWIYRLRDNYFLVEKSNESCGVIDKDENVIVPFNNDATDVFSGLALGDNFLLKQGSYYVLFDSNGKEKKNCEYANFTNNSCVKVTFVNIKANIKAIVDMFTTKGFSPLSGKRDMPSIAKIYKLDIESVQPYEQTFSTPVKVGDWNAVVKLQFDADLKEESYHTEEQNDGWFANEVTVSDGFGWNKDAILKMIEFEVAVPSDIDMENLENEIRKSFVQRGFKQEGSMLFAKNGNVTLSLELYSLGENLYIKYTLIDGND